MFTCSESFRNWLLSTYKALETDEELLKFTLYCCFTTFRDDTTNSPVISNRELHKVIFPGKTPTGKNSVNVSKLIQRFQEKCSPALTFFDLNRDAGKSRVIRSLPKVLTQMIALEAKAVLIDGVQLVDAVTGKKLNVSKFRQEVDAEFDSSLIVCEESYRFLKHLNNLPTNRFTKLAKRIEPAVKWLLEQHENGAYSDMKFLKAYAILLKWHVSPRPKYCQSSKLGTPRIFTNFQGLPSGVKLRILDGYAVTYDIKSCHLAIAAKLWDIKSLQEKLSDKSYSIWKDILPSEFSHRKSDVKPELYAIIYGGAKKNITARLNEKFGDSKWFINHPVIKELFETRNAEMQAIALNGGAYDAFGIFQEVSDERSVPSVMAYIAQSYEVKLLSVVYDIVEMSDGAVNVILHEHDGLSIVYESDAARLLWERRIVDAVERSGKSVGIVAELEVKTF